MSSLPPIPVGMETRIDHVGVHWSPPQRASGPLVLIAAWIGSLAVGIALAGLNPLAGIGVGVGLALAAAALLVPSIRRRDRFELRPDRIWLTRGDERIELLLRDTHAALGTSGSEPALILKNREQTLAVAAGAPAAHLEWALAAIRLNQQRLEAAARRDGRELFTHREAAKQVAETLRA